ncbi:adventurous gliding motility protein T [Bdellovibrio sp. qaytius]|nr:adventurous gliding motility protein T [Bdellovibrio sp. qaytius]
MKLSQLTKALVFTLPLAFMVGCASSEKTSENNRSESEVTDATSKVSGPHTELSGGLKKNGAGSVNSAASASDRLTEAIRAQNDDAISQATTEILTQNPKDLRALNALAMVYYKRGRYEAAEYLINKAMVIDKNRAELYSNMGLIRMAQGEKREAIKAFRKGLELNNDDAVIGANLGSIYVKEKDYLKAELALEVPVRKGTKDMKTLNNYAIALTGTGKYDKALSIYETLMKDNPGQRDIMLNYSILLIDHKQKYREGIDVLNRLKFVGAPSESRNLIKDLESKAKAGLK